jgi:hypothetical protein
MRQNCRALERAKVGRRWPIPDICWQLESLRALDTKTASINFPF